MKTKQKRQNLFERSSQEVMGGLASETPVDRVRFSLAMRRVQAILSATATGFLKRLGMNTALAEEGVQKWHLAMLSGGYKRYLLHANGRPFYPYAMRALWTACCSLRRSTSDCKQPSIDAEVDVADRRLAPDSQVILNELRASLQAALDKLPLEQRQAVELRFLVRMRCSSIAQLLKVNDVTVRTRLYRGLRQMQHDLDM